LPVFLFFRLGSTSWDSQLQNGNPTYIMISPPFLLVEKERFWEVSPVYAGRKTPFFGTDDPRLITVLRGATVSESPL